MNTSTRFLLATGLASLMGLTFLAPSAYAQDAGAPKDAPPVLQLDLNGGQGPGFGPEGGPRGDRKGDHRGGLGGIAGLICNTDGATQLESGLADLGTTLKLTTTQQPLFDAYKTAALSAQTSFAAACPQPPTQPQAMAQTTAQTPPDAVTMLKDRVTRQTAELDALNAVLPSFEALYTSLDDTQKAAMMPLVGPHHGGPMGDDHRGDRGDRAGRHDDRGGDRGGADRGGDDRGNDRGRNDNDRDD